MRRQDETGIREPQIPDSLATLPAFANTVHFRTRMTRGGQMIDRTHAILLASFVWMITLTSGAAQPMHREKPYRTVVEAAKELAPRISRELKAEQQRQRRSLRVAVFPFGNQEGKIDQEIFFAANSLRGELSSELRNLAERRYVVLDVEQHREQLSQADVELSRLKVEEFSEARAELKKIGLDAAIVGSITESMPFFVNADVLFADTADDGLGPAQVTSKIDTIDPIGGGGLSGRFEVDILVDGQALPMFTNTDFYLDLDREQHYGKRFSIRLRNTGFPPVGWVAPSESLERNRFFCAAVFVDGVSSIFERGSDGKFHPSQRHPDNVTKWVLSEPGVLVLPGYDTVTNFRNAQRRVRGKGHSMLEVKGFQLNKEELADFEFGSTGESYAYEVGVTKSIGVISVYFYSEVIDNDVDTGMMPLPPWMGAMKAEVRRGGTRPQKIHRVNVVTHRDPVEIWNIYYRYRGERWSATDPNHAGRSLELWRGGLNRSHDEVLKLYEWYWENR